MTDKINAVASYARILLNVAPEIRSKIQQAMQQWGLENGVPLHEIPAIMEEVAKVDRSIDEQIK